MKTMMNVQQKFLSYKNCPGSAMLRIMVLLSAVLTFGVLLFLILHIVLQGLPHISLSTFAWNYTTENASVTPAIINTLVITLLSLCFAAPLGIFSAIYLVEYAGKKSRFVEIIRITTVTLAGIPSIIYGLFGMLFFVVSCGLGFSLLAGSLTLTIMILPLIIRTTEEALLAVPDIFREGSYGLGAGKLRTIFRIVLPAAVPGILAGIILSVGRIAGETAALVYTAGTVAQLPGSVMSSGRSLAIHMFTLANEGLYMEQAYATAVILLLFVVLINAFSYYLAKKFVYA